jgi:hypothetical protein
MRAFVSLVFVWLLVGAAATLLLDPNTDTPVKSMAMGPVTVFKAMLHS